MRDYFKPLRRKVGVVMLIMALVFLTGWLRTQFLDDRAGVRIQDVDYIFTSTSGLYRLTRYADASSLGFGLPPKWNSVSASVGGPAYEPVDMGMTRWDWHLTCLGFEFGRGYSSGSSTTIVAIPFWIGFPLASLAAPLLILSPQPSKQKRLIEPT